MGVLRAVVFRVVAVFFLVVVLRAVAFLVVFFFTAGFRFPPVSSVAVATAISDGVSSEALSAISGDSMAVSGSGRSAAGPVIASPGKIRRAPCRVRSSWTIPAFWTWRKASSSPENP